MAIELAENGRDFVGNPTKDPVIDFVEGHRGSLIRGVQLQPQQNKSLIEGANLQLQLDVNVIEVDLSKVSDPHIVEVVADQTTVDRADNLSDSISNSEVRACVAVLRKQKEKAQLKAELERLKCEKAGGFVDERHQIDGNEYVCQLSLEHLKHVQDPNIYSALF